MRGLLALTTALLVAGCGEHIVELDPREGTDAGPPDAGAVACVAGTTQCTNCIDDDDDGEIDGFDVECTGGIDDNEGSFETDVPGDQGGGNIQDCFFDGNSGGDEGCGRHVCCILGLDAQGCDDAGHDNNFDPATDCVAVDQQCIDACSPLVPPGCDCFGCCNVCDSTVCYDIYIHPGIAPDCDSDVLDDPVACPRCTPTTSCGSGCEGGADDCSTSAECGPGLFCASGCCITVVE